MLYILNFLHLIGSAVCSQRPTHSFFYYSEQLPLGSRWTGIALGVFTVIMFWIFIRKAKRSAAPTKIVITILSLLIAYFAFDALSSVMKADYVNNFTRLLSGIYFGTAIGLFLMLVINNSLGENTDGQKPIISLKELIILAAINLSFFLAIFFDIKIFLLISAYITIASVIVIFFSLNLAIILMIPRCAKNIASKSTKTKTIIISAILTLAELGLLILFRSLAESMLGPAS